MKELSGINFFNNYAVKTKKSKIGKLIARIKVYWTLFVPKYVKIYLRLVPISLKGNIIFFNNNSDDSDMGLEI